jgi:hypothetical protein
MHDMHEVSIAMSLVEASGERAERLEPPPGAAARRARR